MKLIKQFPLRLARFAINFVGVPLEIVCRYLNRSLDTLADLYNAISKKLGDK